MKHLGKLAHILILVGAAFIQLAHAAESVVSKLPEVSSVLIKSASGRSIPISDMDKFLERQMDHFKLPALAIAIINDGHVVYHRALGYANLETRVRADESTMFEAASMSKPVFAFFVMKMVDRGILDLDTPLWTFLPNPRLEYDKRYKNITARMVLRHTSGLPNWAEYEPPDPSLGLKINKGDLYLKFDPGTGFYYSGEAFQYLVDAMVRLRNTKVDALGRIVDDEVCQSIGMTNAHFAWNDYVKQHLATGYKQKNGDGVNKAQNVKTFSDFSAAGGLRSSAIDFAQFMLALIDERGLSQSSFKALLEPKPKPGVETVKDDENDLWGLGIMAKKTPYGICYRHSGSNGDFQGNFIIFKDRKAGYVFMTNCNRGGDLDDFLEPYLTEGKLIEN